MVNISKIWTEFDRAEEFPSARVSVYIISTMKNFIFLSLFAFLGLSGIQILGAQTLGDFSTPDIQGNPQSLKTYQGKVVLIVNTASRCGFTGQYEGLEKLQKTYGPRGFTVLGFPTNDFFGQEPGSNEEILEFCTTNFKTTFPLFSKITTRGDQASDLYRWLTAQKTAPMGPGPVTWNFNKFLLGPDGKVLARFDSAVDPLDSQIIQRIEKALETKTK